MTSTIQTHTKKVNVLLWTVQVVLALLFLFAGSMKLIVPLEELAKQSAQFLKQLKKMANAARDDLRNELGPEFSDLELRDLDPRAIVRKHIMEAMEDDDEEPLRSGQRPLAAGEVPPYDVEAT